MFKILKVFNEKANAAAQQIVTIAFMAMTVLIFLQVLFRYVIQASLSWSEELARYFFIWLTFIGACVATRERTHIKVTMLIDTIKNKKVKRYLVLFANLLSICFLAVLVRWGIPIALKVLALKQISPSMPFLYIGIVYIAIPLGSFLMLTNLLEISIELLQGTQDAEGGQH